MTGKPPFEEVNNPAKLIMDILSGKMPAVEKEEDFASYPELAGLLPRCWDADPLLRPDIQECLAVVQLMISTKKIQEMFI